MSNLLDSANGTSTTSTKRPTITINRKSNNNTAQLNSTNHNDLIVTGSVKQRVVLVHSKRDSSQRTSVRNSRGSSNKHNNLFANVKLNATAADAVTPHTRNSSHTVQQRHDSIGDNSNFTIIQPNNDDYEAPRAMQQCNECNSADAVLFCNDCKKYYCILNQCNRTVHNVSSEMRQHRRDALPGHVLPPPTPMKSVSPSSTTQTTNSTTLTVPNHTTTPNTVMDNKCDHCHTNYAVIYCYDCSAHYCDTNNASCNKRIHKQTAMHSHQQLLVALIQTDTTGIIQKSNKCRLASYYITQECGELNDQTQQSNATLDRPRTATSRFSIISPGNSKPATPNTLNVSDTPKRISISSRPSSGKQADVLSFDDDDSGSKPVTPPAPRTSNKSCNVCKTNLAFVYCCTCKLYLCDSENSDTSCCQQQHKSSIGHRIYLIDLPE